MILVRRESIFKVTTIASLHIGELAYISEESLSEIPLKLLEMGCLPGAEVELIQIAPLKDPLYICVNGSHLAIRKETAAKIQIIKAPK
jgi:ferrous iron transport protein A